MERAGLWCRVGGLKWSSPYLPGAFHRPMRMELKESPNDDNAMCSLGQHPRDLRMSFREFLY